MGSQHTGSRDTGSRDTGSRDTGSRDTGSRDTGSRDTGSRDTGSRQPDASSRVDPELLALIKKGELVSPRGKYCIFARADFGLLASPSDTEGLTTEPLDTHGATTLLDLFDESSHAQVVDAIGRCEITLIASTTVRNLIGHPIQLTMLVETGAAAAVAFVDPTTLLTTAGSAPGDDTIRTRVICDHKGTVLSADGPPGSYADTNIELETWADHLIYPDDRAEYRDAITSVIDGEPYASIELAGAAPGLTFSVMVAPSADAILIDFYDTSHRTAAVEALTRSQTQFDQLSETLPVGVFVVEGEGRFNFASERIREWFGAARTGSDFGWQDCIHPDDLGIAAEGFAVLAKSDYFNIEIRTERADGQYAWSRLAGSAIRDDAGALEYVVGFVEDISEWRELNSQIAYQASFDGLTDLPNRFSITEELRTRLDAREPNATTGVLFIDLDDFKLINDTQGHSVGDVVLVEVAQRFRRALRPSDLIGRFGSDEFVVVANDISGAAEAEAIGRRLHDILSTPVLAEGRIITVNASIGIALSDPAASSSEELIGDADIAMYEAKATGRNRSVLFDSTLRSRASQRFDMTADLRHARRRRELRLEYQPIVNLQTDQIIGAEALVRWDHPSMGRVAPDVFIPLAEEIGLIDDVGEWVVEQACADFDRLRAQALIGDDFSLSVNASAQQFKNVAMLATTSLASLEQFGLKPSNLRFELTESVPLSEIPAAASRIRQLTSYGFGLAIDDFGTGYSSLGYLTMLPFDVLKLDLSLTAQLEPGSAALSVVECLCQMANEMDFRIVAEGVETDKQHALLLDAGVHQGQGYFISRALPLSGLVKLFEDNQGLAAL